MPTPIGSSTGSPEIAPTTSPFKDKDAGNSKLIASPPTQGNMHESPAGRSLRKQISTLLRAKSSFATMVGSDINKAPESGSGASSPAIPTSRSHLSLRSLMMKFSSSSLTGSPETLQWINDTKDFVLSSAVLRTRLMNKQDWSEKQAKKCIEKCWNELIAGKSGDEVKETLLNDKPAFKQLDQDRQQLEKEIEAVNAEIHRIDAKGAYDPTFDGLNQKAAQLIGQMDHLGDEYEDLMRKAHSDIANQINTVHSELNQDQALVVAYFLLSARFLGMSREETVAALLNTGG